MDRSASKAVPVMGGCLQDLESDEEKLVERRQTDLSTCTSQSIPMKQLCRADGGRDAWLFLAGCFCVEALVWGFPLSYGIFKDYYATHYPFSASTSGIASIGTTATGLIYLGAPLNFALLHVWPSVRRTSSVVGLVIAVISLIASSFANNVWHLILTQGVLYAVGASLLYTPIILFLDEWFVRRKGFAFGVMWAGTGTGGLVVPFIMNWGLQKHGHVIMLRAWALVLLLLTAPLLYYIKPRLPPNTSGGMNLRFLRTRTFWLLQIGNILQGLGYFIPAIYLPSYARSLSLSHLSASLTVSLLNAASVVGQVTLGFLTDKVSVAVVTSISTAGSALAIFAFWGFAESLPLLAVFAVVYGLFAGGFGATWTGIIREVRRREPGAETGMMLGCLAAGRGVGNVLAGPISEALVRDGAWRAPGASGAYGSSYGALIIFTGITALLGGVGCVARWLDERGQKA